MACCHAVAAVLRYGRAPLWVALPLLALTSGLLGQGRFGASYWQDRESVRVAAGVTGHAVRQLYLDCGAVDVAVEKAEK